MIKNSNKIEEKIGKIILFFWFFRRPLIGQIFLQFEKGQNDLPKLSVTNLQIIDINYNSLLIFFAEFCNMSQPAFSVESLKHCCRFSMKSFKKLKKFIVVMFIPVLLLDTTINGSSSTYSFFTSTVTHSSFTLIVSHSAFTNTNSASLPI